MKLTLPLFLAAAVLPLAQAADIRTQPPKDLNGYFPFSPPSSLSEWDTRKDYVRRENRQALHIEKCNRSAEEQN